MTVYTLKIEDFADVITRTRIDADVIYFRLTWNITASAWFFGLYADEITPLSTGIKVQINTPLNITVKAYKKYWFVIESLSALTRNSFKDGTAQFKIAVKNG